MIFKRKVIGLVEPIIFDNGKTYKAKVDTGADSSSIDEVLFRALGDKKVESYKVVKSALGKHKRPTVTLQVEILGRKLSERFTVSDRSSLKYKVLIGKDILKKENFLIDPNK